MITSGLIDVLDQEGIDNTLERININVDRKLIFPDHWPFSFHDIEKINRLALKENLKHIVCTEKDFVKLIEFKQDLKIDINAIVMKHEISKEIEKDILNRLL